MGAICMLGFARNIVIFRVNGASVAEKSWLACATGAGVIVLLSVPARFARARELKVDFFFSLLMLCYCVLHVLRCFVHWRCCIQAMGSTVVCWNSSAFCTSRWNSVSSDRSGMVASSFLAAAVASVILFCFAAENRKSYCNGCMTVANGALAAPLLQFGIDDFSFQIPFKKCFQNRRFSAVASKSSFGAASCVVRSSTGKYFVQAL